MTPRCMDGWERVTSYKSKNVIFLTHSFKFQVLFMMFLAGLVINMLMVMLKCKFVLVITLKPTTALDCCLHIQPTYWHALHYHVDYDNVFRDSSCDYPITTSTCPSSSRPALNWKMIQRWLCLGNNSLAFLLSTLRHSSSLVESQTQLIVPRDVVDFKRKS